MAVSASLVVFTGYYSTVRSAGSSGTAGAISDTCTAGVGGLSYVSRDIFLSLFEIDN